MRYTEEIRGEENSPSTKTETSHAAAISPQTASSRLPQKQGRGFFKDT